MKCWNSPFMVMRACVFSLTIIMIMIMITSVGCGPSADEVSTVSELHNVYDQKYGVRLTLDESTQRYHFQACLLEEKGSFDEESCVDALRSSEGTSVSFAVKDLDELSLTKEEKKKLDRALEDWRPYILAMGKRKTGIALALASGVGGGAMALDYLAERRLILQDLSFYQEQLGEQKALLKKAQESKADVLARNSLISQTFTPPKEASNTIMSEDFIEYYADRSLPDALYDYREGYRGLVLSEWTGERLFLQDVDSAVKDFVSEGYHPTRVIRSDLVDGVIQVSSFVKNKEELAELLLTDPRRVLREVSAYDRILMRASALKDFNARKAAAQNSEALASKNHSAAKQRVGEAEDLVASTLKRLRRVSTRVVAAAVAAGSVVVAFVAFSNHGTSEAVAIVDGLKEKNQELFEILGPSAPLLTTNARDEMELDHLSVKNILQHLASHVSSLADSPSQMVPWYCLPQGGGGEKCWSSQKLTGSLSASFGG